MKKVFATILFCIFSLSFFSAPVLATETTSVTEAKLVLKAAQTQAKQEKKQATIQKQITKLEEKITKDQTKLTELKKKQNNP